MNYRERGVAHAGGPARPVNMWGPPDGLKMYRYIFRPGICQKKLHRQDFLGENFTRKSVNYDKCPLATKQHKYENPIKLDGVGPVDNRYFHRPSVSQLMN